MEQIPVSFETVPLILFKKSISIILKCTLRTQKQLNVMLSQFVTRRFIFSSFRCKIRILDSFGTEPDFNHISWATKHNLSGPYGRLDLIPMQFYTMFRMLEFLCLKKKQKTMYVCKLHLCLFMCIFDQLTHQTTHS